ncbi:hypothetical protein [Anaerovorax odorimutans]|uniref:hypothetical protein n=1 Tax=Anaerovorax odorimutans TaxID=109327 RepID=UPI0003FDC48C|nr:hypothetical protein [Anaerovorax odorimutans]
MKIMEIIETKKYKGLLEVIISFLIFLFFSFGRLDKILGVFILKYIFLVVTFIFLILIFIRFTINDDNNGLIIQIKFLKKYKTIKICYEYIRFLKVKKDSIVLGFWYKSKENNKKIKMQLNMSTFLLKIQEEELSHIIEILEQQKINVKVFNYKATLKNLYKRQTTLHKLYCEMGILFIIMNIIFDILIYTNTSFSINITF